MSFWTFLQVTQVLLLGRNHDDATSIAQQFFIADALNSWHLTPMRKQHVTMKVYRETLKLLKRIGIETDERIVSLVKRLALQEAQRINLKSNG